MNRKCLTRRDECEWLTAAVVDRGLGTGRRQTVH